MSAASTGSAEFTLTLTGEERGQLLTFLEQALRDKEVEEHRTEAFKFREAVRPSATAANTFQTSCSRLLPVSRSTSAASTPAASPTYTASLASSWSSSPMSGPTRSTSSRAASADSRLPWADCAHWVTQPVS